GVAHGARPVARAGARDRGRVVRQPEHGDVRPRRLERRPLRRDDRSLEERRDPAVDDGHLSALLGSEPGCGRTDRLDDVLVAGAPAEVARQSLAQLLLVVDYLRLLAKQEEARQQEAGRAEAALEA